MWSSWYGIRASLLSNIARDCPPSLLILQGIALPPFPARSTRITCAHPGTYKACLSSIGIICGHPRTWPLFSKHPVFGRLGEVGFRRAVWQALIWRGKQGRGLLTCCLLAHSLDLRAPRCYTVRRKTGGRHSLARLYVARYGCVQCPTDGWGGDGATRGAVAARGANA